MNAKYNQQYLVLALDVLKQRGTPHLGRDWLHPMRLDWDTILSLQPHHCGEAPIPADAAVHRELQCFLTKYEVLFRDELRNNEGMQAKLFLKNERPKCLKARNTHLL